MFQFKYHSRNIKSTDMPWLETGTGFLGHYNCQIGAFKGQTRRERLKSALYLSLKKRKTFFWKKLEIFEKNFSFGKCRVVPKNVKGGTLFDL